MSAIFLSFVSLLIQSAFAATVEVPVTAGDRLVVKGLEVHLQLSAQPGTALRISGVEVSASESQYSVTKRNNVIEVKMTEPSGKKTWLSLLPKSSTQAKKIEIVGPALPTEVQVFGGVVVAQKWNKDLKVSLTQGRISSVGGAGTLQLFAQKGDINVQDHNGKVEADSYSGSVGIRNVQGDVEANLFTGQMQIEKVRGFLAVSSQQSNAKVSDGQGSIQFENGKGSLNIQGFQGRVEGQNQEGAVSVQMPLDAEVEIKSKAGRVAIQVPPSSGMALNLWTMEGEIVVPNELRVSRLSSEKTVRGRLRGDAQRGRVSVRSQEGTISVK